MVIGSGLIGSEIIRSLESDHYQLVYRSKLRWHHRSELDAQCRLFFSEVASLQLSQITVIWAAGKASFTSSSAETAREYEDFQTILKTLSSYFQSHSIPVHVILMSSAGGLFEGRRLVGQASEPLPLRPYGQLKLDQEQFVSDLEGVDQHLHLRLTSVYGKISPRNRMGLIPTLLYNGLQNRVSYIIGRQDTIRDYVYAGDVGRAVVQCIYTLPEIERRSLILGSSKPSSLLEVQQCVESIIQRKLFVNYTAEKNSSSITFSEPLNFPFLVNDAMHTNISKIYHAFAGHR